MQTAINSHYSLGFSYSVSCKRHLICLLKCTRNISFPYCFGSARVKRSGASSPWLQVREGPHRHHGWGRMRWRWAHLAQTAGSTAAGTDSDSWLTTQRWAAEMDRWMARGGGRRRWVEVRERDGESLPAYQQCISATVEEGGGGKREHHFYFAEKRATELGRCHG